jgi:hypothetical protein
VQIRMRRGQRGDLSRQEVRAVGDRIVVEHAGEIGRPDHRRDVCAGLARVGVALS